MIGNSGPLHRAESEPDFFNRIQTPHLALDQLAFIDHRLRSVSLSICPNAPGSRLSRRPKRQPSRRVGRGEAQAPEVRQPLDGSNPRPNCQSQLIPINIRRLERCEQGQMLRASRDFDVDLMQRCIALAGSSANEGEYPFAAVIAGNGSFLCESTNKVKSDHDVNRHAEVVALSKAQLVRGMNLSDCTIYSTVEPCAQCSYAIREARIGRVVYGLKSPFMGGHSRWNILSDMGLSAVLPEVFLPAPEIVSGFLQGEIETLFEQWNPLIWQVIKKRGIFVGNTGEGSSTSAAPPGSVGAGLARLLRTRLVDLIRQI